MANAAVLMALASPSHIRIGLMGMSRRALYLPSTSGTDLKENLLPETCTNSRTTRLTMASISWYPGTSLASRNHLILLGNFYEECWGLLSGRER